METSNLLLIINNFHKNASSKANDRCKNIYYDVTTDADAEFLTLLKETIEAREKFFSAMIKYKEWAKNINWGKLTTKKREENKKYAREAVKLFHTWHHKLSVATSFAVNQMESGNYTNGNRFIDGRLSEDLFNSLHDEVNIFCTYDGFPDRKSAPEEIKELFYKNQENIPVHKLNHGLKTLKSINNAFKLQRNLVNEYSNIDRLNSNHGERIDPNKKAFNLEESIKNSATCKNQFMEMFNELLNALSLFHSLVYTNSSVNFQHIQQEEVQDLKLLLENIELFKPYLDEKTNEQLESILPILKKRFHEDCKLYEEKSSSLNPVDGNE